MADTHKTYPTEFKLEAIKLSQQPGHTASSAARDLEIHPYLIHRWIRQQAKHEGAGKPSFTGTRCTGPHPAGSGNPAPEARNRDRQTGT